MANKTFVEKAAEKVGYGLAMAEDLAGAVRTTVAGALKQSPASEEAKGVRKAPATAPARKAAEEPVARKSPAKRAAGKKSPAKKAAKKRTFAKRTPAKKAAKKRASGQRTPAKKAAKKLPAKPARKASRPARKKAAIRR